MGTSTEVQPPPVRQHRRTAAMWGANLTPDARTKLALLEYGEKTSARSHLTAGVAAAPAASSGGVSSSGFAAAAAAVSAAFGAAPTKQAAGDAAAAEDEAAAEAERKLLGQMTGATGTVSGSNVGKILGLEGDAIRRAAGEYKLREDSLKAAAESGEYLAVCDSSPCLVQPVVSLST